MSVFVVYRAVKEGTAIDDQAEWWVVDSRDEVERDGDLVRHRAATKPEADQLADELNGQCNH